MNGSEMSLNVLTLNCWGIRLPIFASKLVTERMVAIADYVSKSDFDIVVLEEVWDNCDYVTLSCKILDRLPYTHYFYSGFVGGGVCLFSRYPIIETMYYNYPLNGHAHKILHGDWYGAKGCGLAVLKVGELIVNVYATHMHARYAFNEFDEYCSHRAAQAFSLSQFVKHSSTSCDAVIVAGDFNSTPNEIAYRVIRSNAVLSDAWLDVNSDCANSAGYTCDTPNNSFTSSKVLRHIPAGQRIDYIFYRANDRTDIRLESCKVVYDKVPDKQFDYSDHYAVAAYMKIKKNITARQTPELDVDVRQMCIKELVTVMEKGFKRARYNKYFYFVTMLLSLMMLLICREYYLGDSGVLHVLLEIVQAMMAVFAGVSFWVSLVLSRCEQNAYMAQKTDLEKLERGLSLIKLNKRD